MVKILMILMLLISGVALISAPWISAVSYTVVSILQPQYTWFWAFDGIPIFKITAGMAILGWLIEASRKNINWEVYKTGQFIALVCLVAVMHLSDLLSPFSNVHASTSASLVLGIINTILIMYFIVLGLVNRKQILIYFALLFIITALWYTYDANVKYLTSDWNSFQAGRLTGTRGGPYRDGNVLSIVLIVGMPFILFGVQYFKRKWVQVALLLTIPFVWHALVLFASRGALLSAAVLTLVAAFMLKSKMLNIMLSAGFVLFLATQGGTLLERATDTVRSSQTQSEKPLNPRLVSWSVGKDLAIKYPILGVGPQRFQYASRVHFPGKSPHVAHNTFLNFSANTGLIAGSLYLSFFIISYRQFKKVRKRVGNEDIHGYINNAAWVALVGYFVGALFLDLIIFEPFYFLLVLISANYFLVCGKARESQGVKNASPLQHRHVRL